MMSRYSMGGIVALLAIGTVAMVCRDSELHQVAQVDTGAANRRMSSMPCEPSTSDAGVRRVQYVAPWEPTPVGETPAAAPAPSDDDFRTAAEVLPGPCLPHAPVVETSPPAWRPLEGYRGFAKPSPTFATNVEALPYLDVVGQSASAYPVDLTESSGSDGHGRDVADEDEALEVVESPGPAQRGAQRGTQRGAQDGVIRRPLPNPTVCESCMGSAHCQSSEGVRILEGVEDTCGIGPEKRWKQSQPLAWELFGPGEYIGPVRNTPVQKYRIRVDDVLNLIYFLSRDEIAEYRLQIGDRFKVESDADKAVSRTVEIMPDGRVSLHLLGYVHVAGRTIPEVVDLLNEQYVSRRLLVNPRVTVTGESVNTRLRDIQSTVQGNVTGQSGANIGNTSIGTGGIQTIVGPDGRINLVGLSSMVCCQGLTVSELQHEINARYREEVPGLNVNVALQRLAPKSVFVVGEVGTPGRFALEGPTRVSQALALAGGARVSGNQREIVIVRHTPEWGVIATKVDLRGFLLGKRPLASDDLWIRDQDIVVVPRGPIQRVNDVIRMLFTDGVYAVVPELGGFTASNPFGVGTLLGN